MLRGQCLGLGVVSVLDKDLAGEGATGFRPALIDRAAGLRVEVDAGASLRSPRQDRRAGLQLVLLGVPRPDEHGHMATGGAWPAIDVACRRRLIRNDERRQRAGLGERRTGGVQRRRQGEEEIAPRTAKAKRAA